MKKYENLMKQTLTILMACSFCWQPLQADEISFTPEQLTQAAEYWLQQELTDTSNADLQIDIVDLDSRSNRRSGS